MTMRLDDGYTTRVGFAADASVEFWEKEVTPPSLSAGGANDTTTMRNTRWRTKAPKKLVTMGDMEISVAYDPAVYENIEQNLLGVNNLITIEFSDGSTLEFWGWLDEFKPNAIVEGAQPTASITIICSNQNDSGVETAPVYTDASSV